ncbi:nickel/cobalt efflux transporter [Chelatococcus sp. SYSU_G07232]|uniref:Nickel/cobalt efflux system n=1 Tax=Chelatococcus albus TaxID=3047466 RepID=A0ABT7ACX5_9HYPH|nr:nickel/cobalt efflux transporter [Chelatococcus sp. SYSU_G07232]MDJ1157235.1 nickel/cobalt efflux transporter [Chelatococcus sp. SYSU_G07232]
MPDIASIISSGAGNPWLFLPAALLLGALHALEPGHAKSLMAAFIVAIRGTPGQAILLGLAAAVGHTIIVWGLALLGLSLGEKLVMEQAEPWLMLASGLLVIALALRLFWPLWSGDDHHGHHHHPHHHHAGGMAAGEGDAVSTDRRHHDHHHGEVANIGRRYAGRPVGPFDIAWFGFTGGLLPCPSAIAVLLVCLHLKAFALGVAMVAAFSTGLAVTLVGVGVAAAVGAQTVTRRWRGFDAWAGRLPFVSAAIVFLVGVVMAGKGLADLGLV